MGGSKRANKSQLFLGQRSRKVSQLVGDILQIDTGILVCQCVVSFRRYAVSSAKVAKKVVIKVMFFCSPNFLGRALKIFGGIYKSTPLPTYMRSLVEIPWLVFHLC